jgi:hypothetical protein
MYYALSERSRGSTENYGLSCDEEGIFLAGDIPLVTRSFDSAGRAIYETRSLSEIGLLLAKSYGSEVDFSNQVRSLARVAGYMTDGKWVLAKTAAVQMRFPVLEDKIAVRKAVAAEAYLAKCRCQTGSDKKTGKRDVSDEPRIPAGQAGGGQWTTEEGPSAIPTNSLLIPVQAIAPPMDVPIPFELPAPPVRLYPPLPLDIPGAAREPANPIPTIQTVSNNGNTRSNIAMIKHVRKN